MSDELKLSLHRETVTAQALGRIDATTKAVVPPLHLSTTYLRDEDGAYRSGVGYTRAENPTYNTAEDLLSALEGGASTLLFASGMAAAVSVFQSLLPGDHVVAPRVMYWALRKWLSEFALPWGLVVDFIDMTDLDELRGRMRPGQTRIVWLETPANPTWEVSDIERVAQIAHEAGARVVVDSTVSTPVLTQPLQLGADLVVHSATKYLNGHSDVLAGAVVTKARDPFWFRLKTWQHDGGAVLGPFEAWLLLRGMRTLFVRVAHSSASALAVAQHFEGHPQLESVSYPGLPSHPQHEIAKRQMKGGFGGMLSLRVKGGERRAVAAAAVVEVFKRATSLGGVESLIEHRASIEGPSTPVPRDLLRLSIGLEHPTDLIADIENALARSADQFDNQPSVDEREPSDDPLQRYLEADVRPMVLDRGAELGECQVVDGVLELTVEGSPGALVPMVSEIAQRARQLNDDVYDVRIVSKVASEPLSSGRSAIEHAQQVVRSDVNPALAAHGGAIEVVSLIDGVARVRFLARCQGCTLAEVTLRQGVEAILKQRIESIETVLDVTDHAAGTDPYFRPGKAGGPPN